MGKVGRTLFGGPSRSSESSLSHSGNVNNDMLTGSLGGTVGSTGKASSMLENLLGLNGGPAQTSGLENFSNSGGMQFLRDQGMKGIESNSAAKGLLNSGSYGQALAGFNNNLASTYLNQYMSNVNDLGKMGLGASGVLADTGKVSDASSQGKSEGAKKGIAGTLIKIGTAIASDPRLKKNIELVGYAEDGLGLYRYDYIEGYGLPTGRQTGVMADEVKQLRPAAYVPNFLGEYAGVDYSKLGE